MRCSLDKEHFEELPAHVDFKPIRLPREEKASENTELQTAAKFLADDAEAPVHHILFREAWKCQESEKRVSIVMATAAAEAAVKNLVGALMRDTIWLLENTPLPPLVKIVKNLFLKLKGRCSFNNVMLSPPRHIVMCREDIVTCRNKISHGYPPPMPTEKESEIWLIAVRDLLWLKDYYNGQARALEYISPAALEDLKRRASV